MTRDEALAAYDPIRRAIQRVLKAASGACSRADFVRAAKQLGLWAGENRIVSEDEQAVNMLADVALFEPNQRGNRAFDRFLQDSAGQLDPADLALARRMAEAFFSIFRVAGRHETAGLWLEDLVESRRLWLMDRALETSASAGMVLAMRLFDAGPFHAGFGIVVLPDDDTVEFYLAAKARGVSRVFRHSLAATLYGDAIRAAAPMSPDLEEVLWALLAGRPAEPATDQGRKKARRRAPSSRKR